MNPPVVLRRAEERDVPALGRLGAMLMRAHHDFDARRFLPPGDDPEAGYAWFLGTQLREPDVVILVAEQGDELVGYVYAGIEPRSWKELRDVAGFVHDVAVVPAARRHGVAELLVEAAAEWLVGRGVARVMLWTAQANGPAQRLFDKLGFRRTMIEMTREADRSR
jgi:ribosomal protein S18 acetylase RimI-like enzyme